MTEKNTISYWLETAIEDLKTAEGLYQLKRYHHALFFCHLALEKILKGLVFKKTSSHAPPIHNLLKLSLLADLKFTNTWRNDLKEITTWNIKARYDNIKRTFYKKATKEFTNQWLIKVKELFSWLKNQY